MRSKARRLKTESGVGLVIVDYLQLMQGPANSESRQQEVSQISRGLKALAKELSVPVVALSQLSRAPEQRTGDNKRPQLSDLRESGAIEQDADLIMFLYRQEFYDGPVDKDGNSLEGKAEVIVGKQRNGPIGTRESLLPQAVHALREFHAATGVDPPSRANTLPLASGSFDVADLPTARLAYAMAKSKTAYRCTECGAEHPKWQGRCDTCGEWNTLVEEIVAPQARGGRRGRAANGRRTSARRRRSVARHASAARRERLERQALDRPASTNSTSCSAAASFPGSMILVGGEPGIGKSTLLLQVAARLEQSGSRHALRVRRRIGAPGEAARRPAGREAPATSRC